MTVKQSQPNQSVIHFRKVGFRTGGWFETALCSAGSDRPNENKAHWTFMNMPLTRTRAAALGLVFRRVGKGVTTHTEMQTDTLTVTRGLWSGGHTILHVYSNDASD